MKGPDPSGVPRSVPGWLPMVALFVAVLLALQAVGPTEAAAADGDASVVGHLLSKRIGDRRMGHDVAMIVINGATGEVVWSRQPDRLMQPASNMKIVTAVTTLAALGPDKRFPTTVLRGRGPRDVILKGGGDPLLSRRNLADLARRTRAKFHHGAKVLVHVDGSLFPRATPAPGWVDRYQNRAVGLVQALTVHGDRSSSPARNAAEYFVAQLRKRGLKAALAANQVAGADSPVVARYRGHSSAQAIARMLSQSDSEIAEVLFRQVAIAAGRPPTWTGSRRAARETLATLGIDSSRMLLLDGSGLSRSDRISPRFLSNVIRVAKVMQKPRFAAMFVPSAMPVAGRSGTLGAGYGRFTSAPSKCARGRVQAKTGTILGTIALSGTAKASSGPRIFSVIVNHRPSRYSALDTRHAVDGLAATVVGCWH
jgi:D-alanyl-D-alanine carboxypeptidase/D-alanyl-D-alanine-endopeptidase (penicillin-binding protein 4)